jgi:hypothetical protein
MSMTHDEQVVIDLLRPLATIDPAHRRDETLPAQRPPYRRYLGYAAIALGAFALVALIALLAGHRSATPAPAHKPSRHDIFAATRGWLTVGNDAVDLDHPGRTRALANVAGSPIAWSRDGRQLLAAGSTLHVIRADGTVRWLVLPRPGGGWIGGGSFTPDGKHVLYAQDGSLWSVPTQGGPPTAIARGDPTTRTMYIQADLNGDQLSPDGRTLLFDKITYRHAQQQLTIGAINPDGSNERTLLTKRDILAAMGIHDWRHSSVSEIVPLVWFGDSSGFILQADAKDGPCAILAVNADGSNLRRFGPPGLCTIRAALAPDGKHIAFNPFRDHRTNILITDQAGHVTRDVVFPRRIRIAFFTWQP